MREARLNSLSLNFHVILGEVTGTDVIEHYWSSLWLHILILSCSSSCCIYPFLPEAMSLYCLKTSAGQTHMHWEAKDSEASCVFALARPVSTKSLRIKEWLLKRKRTISHWISLHRSTFLFSTNWLIVILHYLFVSLYPPLCFMMNHWNRDVLLELTPRQH